MEDFKMILLPEDISNNMQKNAYNWVITGVAGFIGSNLLETLLKFNQKVIGIDNFSTGKNENLKDVERSVGSEKWNNFIFTESSIEDYQACLKICKHADFVLHQAALGSVPRSIKDPISSNNANVNGFLNMIQAAKNEKVKSFIYAASSSTYGDHEILPKKEENIGNPLSPYAVTKYVNELYGHVFSLSYNFHAIGLRYFNVFGKRQDPYGAYAAVIPRWIQSIINNKEIYINGDGTNSRDFCYIDNVIQANILAAFSKNNTKHNVYNVAYGARTSLEELIEKIHNIASAKVSGLNINKLYMEPRTGDVLHSMADISKIKKDLKYLPTHSIDQGLLETIEWHLNKQKE
jgi:UDP-N-acetylglucosamine 4-epimerase